MFFETKGKTTQRRPFQKDLTQSRDVAKLTPVEKRVELNKTASLKIDWQRGQWNWKGREDELFEGRCESYLFFETKRTAMQRRQSKDVEKKNPVEKRVELHKTASLKLDWQRD